MKEIINDINDSLLNSMMIFSVKAEVVKSLRITILKNNDISTVVQLNENDIVDIRYIDQEVSELTGVVGRVSELNENFITLDCSKEFESKTHKILVSDIRDIYVSSNEIQPL